MITKCALATRAARGHRDGPAQAISGLTLARNAMPNRGVPLKTGQSVGSSTVPRAPSMKIRTRILRIFPLPGLAGINTGRASGP
jgi:hypothetical protein